MSVALICVCVVSAIGLTYLLRSAGLLGAGPRITGALPLQQLASDDDQPLLRLVVVWPLAGFLGAAVMGALTRATLPFRTAAVAAIALTLLTLIGAASDAATISEPFASHLSAQASRTGTWVEVALMALGALGSALPAGPGRAPDASVP